eukprot:gene4326-5052_t
MYKKGVVWNKIDAHYVDAKFCTSQGINDPRGCFVLSHDDPVATTRYNTTSDVVAFVANNLPIYSSSPKYMALCFKLSTKLCDGSTTSANFIALVTELVDALNAVVNSNSLPLTFVLDGAAMPIDCAVDLWQPLAATWVGKPWDAHTSNNATIGYDRLAISDLMVEPFVPTAWIDIMCELSPPFGKFLTAPHPILVWEPSTQSTIAHVCGAYVSCQLRHDSTVLPPLRFATNIDPAQLLVYVGTTSSTHSWNARLTESVDSSVAPIILVLAGAEGSADSALIMSLFSNGSDVSFVSLFAAKEGDLMPVSTVPLPLSNSGSAPIVWARIIANNSMLITYDSLGGYVIYSIASSSLGITFEPVVLGQLPPNDQLPFTSSTLDVPDVGATESSIIIVQYYATASCAFGYAAWNISTVNGQQGSTIIYQTCFKGAFGVASGLAAVSAHNPWSPCLFDAVVMMSNELNELTGMYVCIDSSLTGTLKAGPTVLDSGSHPSMSVASYNGEAHIMQVHDNGYCYNTEHRNKRPSPRVCESRPTDPITTRILNYNYGRLTDFLIHIQSGITMSVCDDAILHGTYDQGTLPSVALIPVTQADGTPSLGVVSLHHGVPIDYVDLSACGAPIPHDGLVLDSWPIFPSLL